MENTPAPEVFRIAEREAKESYSSKEIYHDFCTLHAYIDCPPQVVFDYLADIRSLEEFTVSARELEPVDDDGLWVGWDRIVPDTRLYAKVVANRDALTVDYHCAWDQGDELWMVYLYRVVPARTVLGTQGSVLLWTNCHHPHYDVNPRPELAPSKDRLWVGDFWHLFYPGHKIELDNLKAILEYRHANGISIVDSQRQARG
ncbi:SRPBCC family protein [Actinophytocola gossypii]|uniref:SRPBCC family protein n=1 Tax=Actinophytocola gossypii TaxID=2812003 RepID=UPI0021A44F7E|nr:SRPBCC family protein [Actinophytocola gossypii]